MDVIVANETCVKKKEGREDDPQKDDQETRVFRKKPYFELEILI